MTNEQLIEKGDMSGLWDNLYRFTYQQAYRFYTQYKDGCTNAGVTHDDLIQHAYIVMVRAVELYKPDTYRFITYYGQSLIYGYLRLISYKQMKLLNTCVSLDIPLDGDDFNSDTLTDITPDPDGEADIDDVIETEYQRELRRDVNTALSMLSDDERDVIHERFWNGKTLTDISAMHGTTVQEVRSVETKALNTLRKPKALKHLNAYRQDIIDRYSYRGSLEMWRNSHTSSTELTVLKFEELNL